MIRILRNKVKERGGASLFIFTMIFSIVITVSLVVMEYFRVAELYETITIEMERAGNISVEYSMIDDARGYHLSKVDTKEVQEQFAIYFKERLGLTDDYIKKDEDGNLIYRIAFHHLDFDGETPKISMSGNIDINLVLVSNYVSVPVEIPFDVTTRNMNAED